MIAILLFAGSARADGFDAQLYQAATSSSGYLTQESGVVLPEVTLAYETYGALAPDGRNANSVTSQRIADLGGAATFYDCLVEVEKV